MSASTIEPVFFHIDLDAFFASVEILDHPEYKGKPLIIGHRGPRQVVSTCSYEARRYGVHSAMSMARALSLCPNALCVDGNMKRYSEKSKEIMSIISSYSPAFTQASIDEAYLDMSGMGRIYPNIEKAAIRLKQEIKDKTGLTASVGIGTSHFIAKMASDYHKPDGITHVRPGQEELFIDKVGLKKIWGLGDATLSRLNAKHIRTTEDLRMRSLEYLKSNFGEACGKFLYKAARGIEPNDWSKETERQSISTESTYYPDLMSMDAVRTFLLEMSQQVTFRAHDKHLIPRTVGIKLRYGDFTTVNAQTTPIDSIYSSEDVYEIALSLLKAKYKGGGIRLLGVVLSSFYEGEDVEQGELFAADKEKQRSLEKTILSLKKKGSLVQRASLLKREENKP